MLEAIGIALLGIETLVGVLVGSVAGGIGAALCVIRCSIAKLGAIGS